MFILLLLLFYYWLLVSASEGRHHASIYKMLKMLVHIIQKRQFYWIPFTFTNNLYNYYQHLTSLYYKHQHFNFFCKYWPDDGLLRPKPVANNNNNNNNKLIFVSDGVNI